MAYSKDYYSILHLPQPTFNSTTTTTTTNHPTLPPASLRRAYKLALLAAHPDKKHTSTNNTSQQPQQQQQQQQQRVYSVDDVKEAYNVLADSARRREYDNWVLRNPEIMTKAGTQGGDSSQKEAIVLASDFLLGLEVLDLSDFDVLDPGYAFSEIPPPQQNSVANGPATPTQDEKDTEGEEQQQQQQMEWTRACRCGAQQGFRILEEELEDVEGRGEMEVLVGCEGCSLWVRVGFEVEEG